MIVRILGFHDDYISARVIQNNGINVDLYETVINIPKNKINDIEQLELNAEVILRMNNQSLENYANTPQERIDKSLHINWLTV